MVGSEAACRVADATQPKRDLGPKRWVSQVYAQLILDNAGDAFVAIDADGTVIGWNREAERMFGYRAAQAIGSLMADLIMPPEYKADHDAGIARYMAVGHGRLPGKYVELEALRHGGERFPIEMAFWGLQRDGQWQFYSFIRDISLRKEREAALAYRAAHDELTGLANRETAMVHATGVLANRRDNGRDVALIYLDLDRFKMVQGRLGHQAASEIVKQVADRLRQATAEKYLIARVADDEFVIVCHDVSGQDEAASIARRIHDALRLPLSLPGDQVSIGASIGVVVAANDSDTAEDLIREASSGMTLAREHGYGEISILDNQARRRIRQRLATEKELTAAIDNGEFRLHYQPIFQATTERIVGFESLVRWQHPERGLLSPAHFIDLAEDTGLIVPIGQQVLAVAARQAREWQDDGWRNLGVGVNLSARQFSQSGLVATAADILQDVALDPNDGVHLNLEVTETFVMSDPEATAKTLIELKGLGVQLAIDDFGTGYSSLAYLKTFPVNIVKIDRSFIMNIDTDHADYAIVRAVSQLGHALGMKVLAEGVETDGQRRRVLDAGCDLIQGFYYAKPMPAAEATSLLRAEARVVDEARVSAQAVLR